MRETLNNRRNAVAFDFTHDGIKFTASIGYYKDGRPAEVFLDVASKRGTGGMDSMAHDLAVVASLALQYGCPLETIRSALCRLDNDEPAGPLGQAFDHFAANPA